MTTQVFQFPALPRAEWRLPVGVDQISFTHNHFMPNLLSKRHEKWSHMQIVSHRLWFDPGNGFPESSDSTMDASFAEGMIIGEIDAAYTQDGIPITEHDLGGLRNLVIDKLIAQIDSKDAVGRYIPLNEIIVDPQGNVTFNPERKFSKDTVKPVWETIDRFLTLQPNGTVFPDLRNEEFAPFLAELSYKDEHVREHVAVNFYTFSATLASDLVTQVEAFNPHPDWKTRFIGGVLNFYPNELISLAQRLQMPAETVEDMVKVGQRVLRSYPEAGIELFALVATSSGLTPADYPNFPELPASVQQTLLTEEAIVKLVNWARNDDAFPHLKIGSGTRSYDFSIPVAPGSQQREDYTFNLITCLPAPWPKDPILRRIRQLYSTPGRAEEVYNPDFLTTDEPQGASFSCCGIPADDSHGYRHPRFDMIPAGQE